MQYVHTVCPFRNQIYAHLSRNWNKSDLRVHGGIASLFQLRYLEACLISRNVWICFKTLERKMYFHVFHQWLLS